jgi:hypothetical protein
MHFLGNLMPVAGELSLGAYLYSCFEGTVPFSSLPTTAVAAKNIMQDVEGRVQCFFGSLLCKIDRFEQYMYLVF